jgi:hypothetical protein
MATTYVVNNSDFKEVRKHGVAMRQGHDCHGGGCDKPVVGPSNIKVVGLASTKHLVHGGRCERDRVRAPVPNGVYGTDSSGEVLITAGSKYCVRNVDKRPTEQYTLWISVNSALALLGGIGAEKVQQTIPSFILIRTEAVRLKQRVPRYVLCDGTCQTILFQKGIGDSQTK